MDGLYWLLRPSEYLSTNSATATGPFTLEDIHFQLDGRIISAMTIRLEDLSRVTAEGLHFTLQKNNIAGEVIWLTKPPNHRRCPVMCTARRVLHLRQRGCTGRTPIYAYFDESGAQLRICDRHVTDNLRHFAKTRGLDVDVSVGALRCTGATALLQAGIPKELIQLVGRWRSDEVFRYLHAQSTTLMDPIATAMATHFN